MSGIATVNAEQFRNAVFFSLSISRWGNRAKVKDPAKLQEYLALLNAKDGETVEVKSVEGANGAAKTTSTTKVLVVSEKLDALNTFLNETKANLVGPLSKANPSRIKEGLFVLSKELVQEYEDKLKAALTEVRTKYLPAFLDDYNNAKERARTLPVKKGGLGPLYSEKDYPLSGDLEKLFGLDWQWLALGVPEDLPAALRAEAAAKLEKQFSDAAEEVKSALRVGFQELISHAVERLTPSEDGKPKVFRDTLIGNIQQFIDVFTARNIMGDTELQNLVDKAQEVLIGVGKVDELRKNDDLRKTTLEQFTQVKGLLDQMVETTKGRKFDLD